MSQQNVDKQNSSQQNPETGTEYRETEVGFEPSFQLTEEERKNLCKAFTLLDLDGDGVLQEDEIEKMIISWGRIPTENELKEVKAYSDYKYPEHYFGLRYEGLIKYISKELQNANDEEELRESLKAFDTEPSRGLVDLTKLRHYLKSKEMKLTDDEIDFLFREEDYWMLEEKNLVDREELLKKLLDKPDYTLPFLTY